MSTALGDGYCGHDPTGPTACPISGSGTVTGTLTQSLADDYFVFFAAHRTSLDVTINNAQNPECSISNNPDGVPIPCAIITVQLLNGHGGFVGSPSAFSSPNSGVPVAATIDRTVNPGVYYAVVSGGLISGYAPAPYALTVDGSPNIRWPPACLVPRLRRHTGLAAARRDLARSFCKAGRVRYRRDRRAPRGDVISLRPRAGTVLSYEHRVEIYVSG